MNNEPMRLRWGIAGLGWVAGDFMAPAIIKSPGSTLVACVGSSLEKGRAFAQRFDVARVHSSMDGLCSDAKVDAIYIALPNAMHHAAVMAAARAGKHILCEKPFALGLAQAREMADACGSSGIICRVAHQIRLDAAVTRAREIVRSGRLGRLVAMSLERCSGNPPRTTWRRDVAQSGVIFDVGVHLIDLIQWISGERLVEVSAFSRPERSGGHPDDTITVLGRLANDGHAVVRATREISSGENNLIIEGSDATLITSALRFVPEHVVHVRDGEATTEQRFPPSPVYDHEVRSFERELSGVRGMLPDAMEALQTVAATQAVLEALRTRSIVRVEAT